MQPSVTVLDVPEDPEYRGAPLLIDSPYIMLPPGEGAVIGSNPARRIEIFVSIDRLVDEFEISIRANCPKKAIR
jgi:hypothetical protein